MKKASRIEASQFGKVIAETAETMLNDDMLLEVGASSPNNYHYFLPNQSGPKRKAIPCSFNLLNEVNMMAKPTSKVKHFRIPP